MLEFIIHQENELERKRAASKIAPSPATDLKDGKDGAVEPTTIDGKDEIIWVEPPNPDSDPPLINLSYHVEKLKEEKQVLAQGDAAMAASTFFHSDGEVDSMGFDPHSDVNDLPIEVEKKLITTVDSKEKKYWCILSLQEM